MTETAKEYHLIDKAGAQSCGGFATLYGARQYARDEGLTAWEIYLGNTLIERHDPEAI